MNDRIRELAEQATIKSVSENFTGSYSVSGSRYRGRGGTGEKLEITTPSKEWAEKFAELIIAECIDQVEVFNARMDAGPRHIVEAIKEHFGVK